MVSLVRGSAVSRSPYGERGLKFDVLIIGVNRSVSLSLRRAWIEIVKAGDVGRVKKVALLTESVD